MSDRIEIELGDFHLEGPRGTVTVNMAKDLWRHRRMLMKRSLKPLDIHATVSYEAAMHLRDEGSTYFVINREPVGVVRPLIGWLIGMPVHERIDAQEPRR